MDVVEAVIEDVRKTLKVISKGGDAGIGGSAGSGTPDGTKGENGKPGDPGTVTWYFINDPEKSVVFTESKMRGR